MEARLQRRVQRYGWDRAAGIYERSWQAQIAPAHDVMLSMADLRPGERVLDVAAGTGLVTFRAAEAVGPTGSVTGTDISGEMVERARDMGRAHGQATVQFERADAEDLPFAEGLFDVALCGLGLMYVPDPVQALREMRRVLRPGGRAAVAVWGERRACGWAEIFPITDARVASDVCPMFFRLGTQTTLALAFETAGFGEIELRRMSTVLQYRSADEALTAAFEGGPVALAYSRFDAATRAAVHAEYLQSIAAYRGGDGYRIPGEFVVAAARASVTPARRDRELANAGF
ncbi:MAG: methyltransferase domain-containing protein [Geminicoccaceae bacterium]